MKHANLVTLFLLISFLGFSKNHLKNVCLGDSIEIGLKQLPQEFEGGE